MKKEIIVISILFAFLLPVQSGLVSSNANVFSAEIKVQADLDLPNRKNISVLALVAEGVGNNYFDVKTTFTNWNSTFFTTGISKDCYSCPNALPKKLIQVDQTIGKLNDTFIQSFDCLYIPSGGYWSAMSSSRSDKAFIKRCYDLGLIISSMCVGVAILGAVDPILDDKYVISHPNAKLSVQYAGGTIIDRVRTVTDGRIITGGLGFHTRAPYELFCDALIRKVNEVSLYSKIEVQESANMAKSGVIFDIFTQNSSNFYQYSKDVGNPSMRRVELVISRINGTAEEETIECDEATNLKFNATYFPEEAGNYSIDVLLTTSNYEVEVIQDAYILQVEKSDIRSIPGYNLMIFFTVGMISILLSFIRREKKRN